MYKIMSKDKTSLENESQPSCLGAVINSISDDGGYNDGQIAGFERGARFMFDKFATEQSIISEIKSKEFKKCGIGDNVCNCKEEKDCGYL